MRKHNGIVLMEVANKLLVIAVWTIFFGLNLEAFQNLSTRACDSRLLFEWTRKLQAIVLMEVANQFLVIALFSMANENFG